MNNIVLKIKMSGECELSITLVYLTEALQADDTKLTIQHRNLKNNFYIYSRDGFGFGYAMNSIRLPDAKNYKNKYIKPLVYSRIFNTNEQRYMFLKNLYLSIKDMGSEFINSRNSNVFNSNIILNEDYWIY